MNEKKEKKGEIIKKLYILRFGNILKRNGIKKQTNYLKGKNFVILRLIYPL